MALGELGKIGQNVNSESKIGIGNVIILLLLMAEKSVLVTKKIQEIAKVNIDTVNHPLLQQRPKKGLQ